MRLLKQRERVILVGGVVLVALVFVCLEGVVPMWARWSSLRHQTHILSQRLWQDRQLIAQDETIRATYAQDVRGAFLSGSGGDAAGMMLQAVDRIASQVGAEVRIRELRAHPAVDEDNYRILGVELEVEGNLMALGRLVHALEHAQEKFRVTRLQVRSLGVNDDVLEGRLVVTQLVVSLSGG